MNVIDLIRNEHEFPWEYTPRQKVLNAANPRWRAYCLMQATALGIGAIATVIQPSYFGTLKDRRRSVKINVKTIRGYLGMAGDIL